ncbi:hypothetical protein ACJJTC_008850 [Scirpophaga incertulas]
MYSLVQFKDNDGGTLSIVNSEWLTPRKNEVYWPPVKGTKAFERLLTCSPNEKWHLYGVQRVFCETVLQDKNKYPGASLPNNITTARHNNSDFTQEISIPTLPSSILQNLEQGFVTNVENKRQETDDLQLTGFQDKVVSLLTLIKIQNDQILSILKHKRMGVNLKPDYKFPLKTNEDLENTEKLLKIEENYENLVSYLETLGGRDTSNKVSRIMKTLLADGLSKEFNFYGEKITEKTILSTSSTKMYCGSCN